MKTRFLRMMTFAPWFMLSLTTVWLSSAARAETPFIIVASTSSTENSGLFDYLLPKFQHSSGIYVRVLSVGTGQAVRLAQNGDADILFVHHKPSEERFVSEGFGVERFDVMYNEFVLVGPALDPAAIGGQAEAPAALKAVAQAAAPFVSRGDGSGTHKRELSLWQAAGIDVSKITGGWYRETGSGMGATLNIAAAMEAYTLADSATWLNFHNRRGLKIMLRGDPLLFNQYGVILVNKAKHTHIKSALGQHFIDWLLSATGQSAINSFTIEGERAFTANAPSDIVIPDKK